MEEVIRIFNQIQATRGKNDKQSIIAANKDNELFKKCITFLLDTNITTGISKAKISKRVLMTNYITIDKMSFEQLMEYIEVNNTGKDSDLSIVQSFIENQPVEHREFYEQMITKSMKLGCEVSTVNKAIPNLIRTWEVMLGSPIDKCKVKDGEWFSLSKKLNGNRCSFSRNHL
jgi:DNA ligase-1